MYINWSRDDDSDYLTLNLKRTEELFDANIHSLNGIKLQAGNSLATWCSRDQVLFIAFSRDRPREACIDIQLDEIHSVTARLLQLRKADPLRTHKVYPKVTLSPALSQTELPSQTSSGQVMYGELISGIGSTRS